MGDPRKGCGKDRLHPWPTAVLMGIYSRTYNGGTTPIQRAAEEGDESINRPSHHVSGVDDLLIQLMRTVFLDSKVLCTMASSSYAAKAIQAEVWK
jgi:hypothetical protein